MHLSVSALQLRARQSAALSLDDLRSWSVDAFFFYVNSPL